MRLSVVVTIVDAGDALERCLTALAAQEGSPDLEVLVPWDDSVPGIGVLQARFPGVTFLPMGPVIVRHPASFSGQHELFDRRRATGVAAATADIIAILEDRGVPRRDWAKVVMRLHREWPHAVIGGAVENADHGLLNWAVYFCDFGRYQRPFVAGARDWVSDVNVAYKQRALEQTRPLWRDRYHETTVHWALRREGETLFLSPDAVVDQMRGQLRFTTLLAERFAWGRLYAQTRARESGPVRRAAFIVLAPLLPVLLFARLTQAQIQKRVSAGVFVRSSPAVIVLMIAWSLGEGLGYVNARS